MTGAQALDNLAAATEPAAIIEGGQWNPLVVPMIPDATGQTLTIGRTLQFDRNGPVFAYSVGSRLAMFDTEAQARAAIEAHAVKTIGASLAMSGGDLVAADLLGAIRNHAIPVLRDALTAMELDPEKNWRFVLLRDAVANAEGRGLRAQSFNDRERDLLAANVRQEARAREAEARERVLEEAVSAVLAHRVGDLPGKGWLRDNDASRRDLASLAKASRNSQRFPNGAPKWAQNGTFLAEDGNRSIFDDVDAREDEQPPRQPSGVLCYVANGIAYFTTAPLTGPQQQWGDDWNDAPYEHNAGTPYDEEGVTITAIPFMRGDLGEPCDSYFNSPWSVEQINEGATPWLSTIHNGGGQQPIVSIPAGATFAEFQAGLLKAGGTALMPWRDDPAPLPRVRHKKRRSTYEVLGEAEAQIATYAAGQEVPLGRVRARQLNEGDKLTVYRANEDGKLWLRFPDEFADGRFEEVAG